MNLDNLNRKGISFQAVSYLLVGGTSALGELVIFQTAYAVLHLPPYLANIVALIAANIYTFLLNRNVTFSSTSKPVRSLALYLCLLLFNTVITSILITLFVETLGINSVIAKLSTQVMTTLWNFFIYRKVIFI